MKKFIINSSFALGLIILVALPTLINSCKKTESSETINTIGTKVLGEPSGIMAYYNFTTQKSDGVFAIKQYGTQITQDVNRSTQFGGFFTNSTGNAMLGGNLKIGETTLQSDPANNFMYGLKENNGENLYGQSVSFTINQNAANVIGGGTTVYDSLYVPQKISLLAPAYSYNSSLNVGTSIKWNIDSKDTKGVIILLEYDPEFLQNASLKASGYNQRIYRAITVADSLGNYTFTNANFTGLPNHSKVIMSVGRANYKTLSSTNLLLNYSVYAYTIVESIQTLNY